MAGVFERNAAHLKTGADPTAPSPEDVLRTIFAQAFAAEPIHLPEGATVALLREAVALPPDLAARIFNEEKQRAAASRLAIVPEQAGHLPAASAKPGLKAAFAVAGTVLLLLASLCAYIFIQNKAQKPMTTSQLYSAAGVSQTAFALLLARANQGEPEAQFDLATLYDSNLMRQEITVPKNDKTAFHWYALAANGNSVPAANNMGYAYRNGHGVAQNYAVAAAWYYRAASQGLADAQDSLGMMYQNGLGVPQSDEVAIGWYQQAAAQGLASAENNLGAAYEAGRGTGQDYVLAEMWFSRAASQGDANAQNSLGFLYYNGFGVAKDYAQSFKWFSLAAAQGNPAGQVNLGLSYARGEGVAVDNLIAAKWFLLAQQRGDKDAAAAINLISPPLTDAQLAQARAAAQNFTPQIGVKPNS